MFNLNDFDLSVIYLREDGSYVVDKGLYHVPNEGDWVELWKQIDKYVEQHPDKVQPEPTFEEQEAKRAAEEFASLTPEEQNAFLQKQYTDLIQSILDVKAQSLGYDNCNSVCTYIDTGVQKFDDEGVAFRKWRSAVWAKGYELLAEVKSGVRAIPTSDELIQLLPSLEIIYTAV